MKKVRALFEHFRIPTGDKTYDGHDYLRVAYEIRKKVAHEGNIGIRERRSIVAQTGTQRIKPDTELARK